ncbi:O-methyltransferase [Patescibacteria group bacterium]
MNKEIQTVLETLEQEAKEKNNPYWIISHETGEFLSNLIRENNMKRALEVGTSVGYSGIWLAEALTHTGGKLYTIESHNERFKIASENFHRAGLQDYITQLKGHAPDVEIPDMFDLLFLDATKIEHLSYLTAFLFHMKKGGIIVADNALSHEEEMKNYKDYIFNSDQLESKLIKIGTGLYYSKIV